MIDTEKEIQTDATTDKVVKESEQQGNTQHSSENESTSTEAINYKDLFLRLNADFQNFKKRIEKQKSEWMLSGEELVILKLLPVIQDLERALNTPIAGNDDTVDAWVNGLNVVHKNFLKSMTDLGLQEINHSGEFNPELHEAIAQVESTTNTSGQIVDVVSKGYLFKGKVIKYAQVTVAK